VLFESAQECLTLILTLSSNVNFKLNHWRPSPLGLQKNKIGPVQVFDMMSLGNIFTVCKMSGIAIISDILTNVSAAISNKIYE
jgi:hypothetical protein